MRTIFLASVAAIGLVAPAIAADPQFTNPGLAAIQSKVAQAAEAITSERIRALAAESANASAISGVITSIANEVIRAQGAESTNATSVATERTRAIAAEALAFPASSAGTAATQSVGPGGVAPFSALAGKVDAAGGDASGTNVLASGGTTLRTAAGRWSDIINVRDLGLPCDGSDQTAALQFAVNALAGSTLRIPRNCAIDATGLDIPAGVTRIVGDGDSSILKFDAVAIGHFIRISQPGSQLYLSRLKVDGQQALVSNSSLASVRMSATGTSTSSALFEAEDVTFANGRYADVSMYTPDDTGTPTKRVIKIHHSRFLGGAEGSQTYAPAAVQITGAADVDLQDNDQDFLATPVAAGRGGFVVYAYGSSPTMFSRVNMSGNRCHNVGRADSATLGCYDLYSGVKNAVVNGNVLDQPYGRGIAFKADLDTLSVVGNSIIGLNQVAGYGNAAINSQIVENNTTLTTTKGNYTVVGNTLSASSNSAMSFSCSNAGFTSYGGTLTIGNNTIANPTFQGIIVLNCGGVNVEGNAITGSTGSAAISIGNRQGPITVTANHVRGTGRITNNGTGAGLWSYGNYQDTYYTTSDLKLTPSNNSVTAWMPQHCIDTASVAQSVSLISGVPDGQEVTITACSVANALTLTNHAGSGNLYMTSSTWSPSGIYATIKFVSRGGVLVEVARSSAA